MKNKNRIIIALDKISIKESLKIARDVTGLVWGFKINDLLFEDMKIIPWLKKFGRVFADVKLYDIPNTVSNSVKKLSIAGADMITVHASGGIEMMKAAKKSAGRSKILAVTILTSKHSDLRELVRLTRNALEGGVDGVVCSGLSLSAINRIPGTKSLLKVVPGIRPKWYKRKDDQKQTITPRAAVQSGAQFLVIGRPILNADNPSKTVKKILEEMVE